MPKLKYKKNNEWIDLFISDESKTDISSAVVTLSSNSYTYDGTQKEPTVTSVVLDSKTLTIGTDYEVTSSSAINAGTYTIAITGIGDYEGTITVNWTIDKAQAAINGASLITITGVGESYSETYTSNSDGVMSFSIGDSSIATIIGSNNTATLTSVALGTTTLTVSVAESVNYLAASKTVNVEIESTVTVFGVMWDYSLSSPALTRLTPESDPLGVVTNTITTEPTACVGNDGNGQSEFDNYLPWSGMVRKNYVNGQVVDFTGYDNGETFVYIPEFWSKIVDDAGNSKMYIYISSDELADFKKHSGSGRCVSRYECNDNFLSKTGATPKNNTTISAFRTGITAIDNYHFQYDIHCYSAIQLLYIVEFANLNSQAMVGAGITGGSSSIATGSTDTLTYHTGRTSGTDDLSAVQYRWIENLWGNLWSFVDGIVFVHSRVYTCDDPTKYQSWNTSSTGYINTEKYVPTSTGFYKTSRKINDCCLIPGTSNGSTSTYTCDSYTYAGETRYLFVGGYYEKGQDAGLFCWASVAASSLAVVGIGSRSILVIPNGGD